MAATDLNDLNNFEYHFETAAATFLNADLGIDVFRTVIEDRPDCPPVGNSNVCGCGTRSFCPAKRRRLLLLSRLPRILQVFFNAG